VKRFHTWLIPILVFLLVLVTLLGGWVLEKRQEQVRVRAEFHTLSRQVTVRIHDFMDTRVAMLTYLASRLGEAPDPLTAYRQLAPDLHRTFPGFQAINLVNERGVIVAVYPEQDNAPALNHDLTTSPRSGPLYRTMVREQRPVLSGVVPLFDGGTGSSLFIPIVSNGRVTGAVLGVFDMADLVQTCLRDGILNNRRLIIRVSGQVLYDSQSSGEWESEADCTAIVVPVVDRNWEFTLCDPNAGVTAIPENYLVVAGAFLVALVVAFLTRRYLREQQLVRDSETRLAAILDAVPDVMLVITRDGRVADMHAPLGMDWFPSVRASRSGEVEIGSLLPKPLADWVMDQIGVCLETLLPVQTEGTLTHQRGTIHVDAVLSPYDEGHVLLIFRDISERHRAEERLRESERQLRTIFDASQDCIFMTTSEGRIEAINPAGVALFRAPSLKALRRVPVRDLYEDPDERDRLMRDLRAEGAVFNREVRMRRLDDTVFPAMVSTRLHPMPDGTERLIGTLKDLSEVKDLQAQLIQAQKLESIGRLAGGIAHDFNNILGSILGFATLMKSKMSPRHPFYKYVDTIERGAVRAGELTAQLLGFARKGQYTVGPVDLNRLVTDTVKLLSSTIEKSIEIRSNLVPDLPPVQGDLSQLHQVLMNLCVNARDAMPDGGVLTLATAVVSGDDIVAVDLPEHRSDRYVRVSVRDTGVGMTREVMERIFEPFFTTKEQGKGTGLGLSMVYGVVRNHQGTVRVESEPGSGTVFHVYLPVAADAPGGAGDPEADDASVLDESGSGEGYTVLFVDDEADNRALAEEILGFAGYRVLLAENGEAAIALFREHRDTIDGIILDLMMPKMGGIEALAEIRKLDADVPVLFVSGYAPDDKVKAVMARERAGFVRKPFQLKELLAQVEEMVGRNGGA